MKESPNPLIPHTSLVGYNNFSRDRALPLAGADHGHRQGRKGQGLWGENLLTTAASPIPAHGGSEGVADSQPANPLVGIALLIDKGAVGRVTGDD
jgi:hypothetical protein